MTRFDKNTLLKDHQHGFRKRCSCETQLTVTIQEIASRLSKGNQVDIILLDFAKAFDKVPYSRLLHKLDFYWVRNQTSNWIKFFLENRKQEVVLDGSHSDQSDVLSGVPQGTVLGPLLFLAYINDMPESLRSSDYRLFADDSLLYCAVNKASDCKLLQQDLTALEQWETDWQMSFNPSKCTVIRVHTGRSIKYQSTYTLHGQTLEVVDGSKYLGVTVTDNLSWSRHVSETAGKAQRSLGFLRRNFKHCSRQVKSATYTSVVRPVLEYASPVWDPYHEADIKALEQVQRRAARYVYNDYTSRTPGCVTDMVNELGWESLQDRRQISRLCLLYKSHHGLVDIDKTAYLKPGDSRTRSHTGFYQEHIKNEVYYNSFFPRTIRDWNRLPNSLTSSTTVDGFRASLYTRLTQPKP